MVSGYHVGYLGRDDARLYSQAIALAAEHAEQIAVRIIVRSWSDYSVAGGTAYRFALHLPASSSVEKELRLAYAAGEGPT